MAGARDVVVGFQKAMGSGDWAAARRHLADDLAFKGPFESFDRADAYLEAIQKLHSIVERVDPHKMLVDGDDVCLLYDLVTRTPAGTAFVAEWYRVKGGKIHSIRAVFDARPFAAMFGR